MNKHCFVVIGIAVIFLFTALAGAFKFHGCRALFHEDCQRFGWIRDITGLVATALVLFFLALIFSLVYTIKKLDWASYLEFGLLAFGAILMLAAVCLNMSVDRWRTPSPTMCTIAMTLSIELSVVLAVQFLKGKSF
ncbi:unnamed protein product [Rodentolepis nana]|uniref:DUF4418 family protein n=1 Tax=Rodentolepis nana TaxID=102285 RepID=A0A0R3TZA2_RODNA|nr:unnamed protein product [Rodentolepis nana]